MPLPATVTNDMVVRALTRIARPAARQPATALCFGTAAGGPVGLPVVCSSLNEAASRFPAFCHEVYTPASGDTTYTLRYAPRGGSVLVRGVEPLTGALRADLLPGLTIDDNVLTFLPFARSEVTLVVSYLLPLSPVLLAELIAPNEWATVGTAALVRATGAHATQLLTGSDDGGVLALIATVGMTSGSDDLSTFRATVTETGRLDLEAPCFLTSSIASFYPARYRNYAHLAADINRHALMAGFPICADSTEVGAAPPAFTPGSYLLSGGDDGLISTGQPDPTRWYDGAGTPAYDGLRAALPRCELDNYNILYAPLLGETLY